MGEEHWQGMFKRVLDFPIESSRWISVLMFEYCDSNSLAQAQVASVGFVSNPRNKIVFGRLQISFIHEQVKTKNLEF